MPDPKKGYLFDLMDDFVVSKTQDSPDNFSARRDAEKIDAHSVTKEGDINENEINSDNVNLTKEGYIIEGDQKVYNIENININLSSCKTEDDTPSELEPEPVDVPTPDLSFELGG
jgi:hypothetical protein